MRDRPIVDEPEEPPAGPGHATSSESRNATPSKLDLKVKGPSGLEWDPPPNKTKERKQLLNRDHGRAGGAAGGRPAGRRGLLLGDLEDLFLLLLPVSITNMLIMIHLVITLTIINVKIMIIVIVIIIGIRGEEGETRRDEARHGTERKRCTHTTSAMRQVNDKLIQYGTCRHAHDSNHFNTLCSSYGVNNG